MGWSRGWAPYVPVAKRRAQAAKELEKLNKNSKGKSPSPVHIATRKMAVTFWGEAWCENLENYSDYSNRLPRGRTYARNGSILDLQIEKGCVTAMVSGSSLYRIKIDITTIPANRWNAIKSECAQSIHSIMDLLRGKLSDSVMKCLTAPKVGLFPQPNEIRMRCSCPDSASLCKHLAAVMFGIGNRLDTSPELLFLLRGVEKSELVSEVVSSSQLNDSLTSTKSSKNNNSTIADEDLGSLFGIDLVSPLSPADSMGTDSMGKRNSKPKPSVTKPAAVKVTKESMSAPKVGKTKTKPTKASKTRSTKVNPVASEKHPRKNKPNPPISPGLPVSLRIAMEKLERMENVKSKKT